MSEPRSTDASRGRAIAAAPPRTSLHRYFFYGWMFRDADRGSMLEREAALRHNRDLARWLPTYLRRWLVVGALLSAAEVWAERSLDAAVLAAMLAVAVVLVIVFLVVTGLCWIVLRGVMR